MNIRDLKPQSVFTYFEEILQIPRPSKKEEKIIAYLKDFAIKNSFDYEIDMVGNVVIRKPATKGFVKKIVIRFTILKKTQLMLI